MATAIQPVPHTAVPEAQSILLPGVRWQTYKALGEDLESANSQVRLTYDRGSLEIMTHGWAHEVYASGFAAMIGVLCEAMEIEYVASGSATCQRDDLEKGFEPDQSFYFQNAHIMFGKHALSLPEDPPPDLTIEVEITRTALDRMAIFAATGVPEVWRFNGDVLSVHRLNDHGTYVRVERSEHFPDVPIQELVPFLRRLLTQGLMSWRKEFRNWVVDRLGERGTAAEDAT
ncbi:MAG: Uma2 family endonuclease [Isosphaeraceae bacterium]|nr:Uma2 family endonuclease [Isosphaeraceae bacterium]